MSKKVPVSKQNKSQVQLELNHGNLPPDQVLRIVAQLVTQVKQIHESGILHRAISVEAVSVWKKPFKVSLESFPEESISLGGRDSDFESCPPELQGSALLQVPADLNEARQLVVKAGISFDPVRIDIYQLGALICRLLTGESVESYLQSPQITNSIPADLRRLIDRALGYQAEERINVLKDLQSDISNLMVKNSVTDPAQDTKTSLGRDGQDSDTNSERSRPQASSLDDDLPFDRLGHYEIVGRIGHGGMGDVYQGYEKDLDRTVAIKVLPAELARSDDFVKRFYAEATAAAKLSHANIIEIYYIGKDQGHHFFAMQYVEGESLSDLLRQRERLEVQETVAIISQALSGLDAAHNQGLVHRDIKPGNLLIDEENKRILLADFGLVKSIQNHTQMTATGMIMGTVDYISPEQGRGQEVDGRADLYAIGVMMYQMLSGRLPFAANSPTAMIFQHVYESPTPLAQIVPNVPRSLISIVDKLMAKSPDDRYQDARTALAELRLCVNEADQERSHQRSSIIKAPSFDELTIPSSEWTDSAEGSDWWSRTRERMLDLFRAKAPEFLQQLQNTQHQVDGAVAEYERRCDRIQQLADEAEEVQALLQTQADSYQQLVIDTQARMDSANDPEAAELLIEEKIKHQRMADEIEEQIKEQQQQLEEIHSRLSEAKTKLVNLRSQRDILSARLKVAQAKSQQSGGRTVNKRKRMLIFGALGIAVVGSLFAAVVLYKNWNKSDNNTNPNQVVYAKPPTITNSIGMKFNLIPRGKFLMGSPENEEGRYDDEQQHEVEITEDFYLGIHEVTQWQWMKVMGTAPWRANRNAAWVKYGDNHAATFVSWKDAVEFCKRLSEQDGNEYRLPTEAEWERACRADTRTRYSFGDDEAKLGDYAWYYDNSYKVKQKYAHRVSTKEPNPFGLYNMHGNVWEWCLDWYADDYYAKSAKSDPTGPSVGSHRANRGGGWDGQPGFLRSANRGWRMMDHRSNRLGFRVVCNGKRLTPSMQFTAANPTGPKVEITKAVFGVGRTAIRCEKRISEIIQYQDVMTEISTRGLQIRNPRGGYRTQLEITYRITDEDVKEGTLIIKTESWVNIYKEIIKHAESNAPDANNEPLPNNVSIFVGQKRQKMATAGFEEDRGW